MSSQIDNSTIDQPQPASLWWDVVQNQVKSLRFGDVHIVVHDSRVVQVECTEKVRFDKEAPNSFLACQITGGVHQHHKSKLTRHPEVLAE
ncbi:MAG: DUF2292 domain-containing protein [Chloroflexi bacterium]|nr:DUF2292 domain-containing protein [Chloroflexota bacterium]